MIRLRSLGHIELSTRDRDATDRGIALQDPIEGMGDPLLDELMTVLENDNQYADLPVISAREMQLILAEDALVRGDMTDFDTHINQARTWSGLSTWDILPDQQGRDRCELLHKSRMAGRCALRQRRLT